MGGPWFSVFLTLPSVLIPWLLSTVSAPLGQASVLLHHHNSTYASVFVCSGCHSRRPKMGWLVNDGQVCLTLLEVGSPRSGTSRIRVWFSGTYYEGAHGECLSQHQLYSVLKVTMLRRQVRIPNSVTSPHVLNLASCRSHEAQQETGHTTH